MTATKKVDELRTEYRAVRRSFMHEDSTLTKAEFDARALKAMVKTNASLPVLWLGAAKSVTTRCGRCAGTGQFITYVENGQPKGPGGICYRCEGKGFQGYRDIKRNETHDEHYDPTYGGTL